MINSNSFNLLFWKHYMILEEEFIETNKYVELNSCNYNAFSAIYLKLLQSIGSEFDVVCKEICNFYDKNDIQGIDNYAKVILPKFPGISNENIIIRNNSLPKIKPLDGWKLGNNHKSPQWWKAYNDVKHDRARKFKLANLKNILFGLGSLYLIEMNFIFRIANKDDDHLKIPNIPSRLFDMENNIAKQVLSADGRQLIEYK